MSNGIRHATASCGRMPSRRASRRVCASVVIVAALITAQEISAASGPPAADTFTRSTQPTQSFGTVTYLQVDGASRAWLRFDLSILPAATMPADVAKATLTLWVNKVLASGAFEVAPVIGAWPENTVTDASAPAVGAPIAPATPVTAQGVYVTVDVTSLVHSWLGGMPNDGLALLATPGTSVLFDSKESVTTSHSAALDITLTAPAGPQGPQGSPGTQGAQGIQGPPGSANINGTTNFLTKFTSPTTGGNSLLFDDGTNLGLGTAAPGFPFQIVGNNGARNLDVTNTLAGGDAIWGFNTAPPGTGSGAGVVGITSQVHAFAAGVIGQNLNPNGTGVIGVGNNQGFVVPPNGAGGVFIGATTGVYAKSNTAGIGEAVLAEQFGDVVRVAYWNGSQFYKIHGTGTVSTHVQDPTDPTGQRRVSLHAPETPEIYFMDFGSGVLKNGRAHIELDARLTGNVTIDGTRPMRVFIQLEENEHTRGVVVKNKTKTGFDVVEIGGGKSNQPFQWHAVMNRADEQIGNGEWSRNSDTRFEPAPDDRLAQKK